MDKSEILAAFAEAIEEGTGRPPADGICSDDLAASLGVSESKARTKLLQLFRSGKAERFKTTSPNGGVKYYYVLRK